MESDAKTVIDTLLNYIWQREGEDSFEIVQEFLLQEEYDTEAVDYDVLSGGTNSNILPLVQQETGNNLRKNRHIVNCM